MLVLKPKTSLACWAVMGWHKLGLWQGHLLLAAPLLSTAAAARA